MSHSSMYPLCQNNKLLGKTFPWFTKYLPVNKTISPFLKNEYVFF